MRTKDTVERVKRLKEENLNTPEFIDQETLKALDDLKVRFIKQFLKENQNE